MTTPARDYTILSRTHIDKYDPNVQTVVSGWQLKAQWANTGTILSVFVPDSAYTEDGVDAVIRAQGALDDRIGQLGASGGGTS